MGGLRVGGGVGDWVGSLGGDLVGATWLVLPVHVLHRNICRHSTVMARMCLRLMCVEDWWDISLVDCRQTKLPKPTS